VLEENFRDAENQVRTLAADLVEGMWAQRRRVIGIKQRIQQYGPKEEKTRTHGERGRVVDKGMVPSLDERFPS
jgi:hypothetical protein